MSREPMDMAIPLLRSPPFPGVDAAVSQSALAAPGPPPAAAAINRLFAIIREAQVGGRFWAPPARQGSRNILLRPKTMEEIATLSATLRDPERTEALWLPRAGNPRSGAVQSPIHRDAVLVGTVDPWSLLKDGTRLYVHGDDEWVALALIAGCPVHILSAGRFGAPGATEEWLREQVAQQLLRVGYRDPFTGRASDIETAIAQLADWRRTFASNRNIIAACGIAWWKRHEIARFLWTPEHALRFFRSERRAIAHAARHGGAIAAWPSRISAGMADAAQAKGVRLVRIEDGFVRSVGLGSNLVPPSSIAVDRLGIHYDPGRPSDLETLLARGTFPPALLVRAEKLRRVILAGGISKYGGGDDHVFPPRQSGRRLVLVPGQVEDDMSVQLGGGGLSSNLELVRRTRGLEPEAEIWFRPHPDVDAGHRKGAVRDADMLHHADRVVRGGAMARLLERIDAVHVLTSLTGFEALLRGKDVTCHGTPFYAGWGLTRDLGTTPDRRGRRLSLGELLAAILILYPRYLDPVSHLPCPPEVLIGRMGEGTARNRLGWVTRLRQFQGRLTGRRSG